MPRYIMLKEHLVKAEKAAQQNNKGDEIKHLMEVIAYAQDAIGYTK